MLGRQRDIGESAMVSERQFQRYYRRTDESQTEVGYTRAARMEKIKTFLAFCWASSTGSFSAPSESIWTRDGANRVYSSRSLDCAHSRKVIPVAGYANLTIKLTNGISTRNIQTWKLTRYKFGSCQTL